MLQILEQAAKVIGGAYGDKRRVEFTGPGGGTFKSQSPYSISDADLEKLIAGERAALRN
ncbi:MAG: hypothetical protein V9G29_15510 [Burkholderiaceae bacterium]